jgi:hypothetical protein
MRSCFRVLAFLSFAAALPAASVAAQGPEPSRGRGVPAPRLLLSNVGELELTDAQVVRLAAIARRSEMRRKALRASMDSARARYAQPGDSIARRQFRDRMRVDLDRALEQERVDQRDAIAVLNADQQVKAWQLVSNRGRAARSGMRGMRGGRGPRPMLDRRRSGEMRDRMRRPDGQPPRAPGLRGRRSPLEL